MVAASFTRSLAGHASAARIVKVVVAPGAKLWLLKGAKVPAATSTKAQALSGAKQAELVVSFLFSKFRRRILFGLHVRLTKQFRARRQALIVTGPLKKQHVGFTVFVGHKKNKSLK